MRNNTIGAEVVASEHYRHGCLEGTFSHLFHLCGEIVIFRYIGGKFPAVEHFEKELRQSIYCRSSHYQFNLRIGALYFLGNMALSCHAACNADNKRRLQFLQLFHASDDAENSVLGAFTDSTGVEYDKVGFVFVIREAVAYFFENAFYLFSVRNVELTSETSYIGEFLSA